MPVELFSTMQQIHQFLIIERQQYQYFTAFLGWWYTRIHYSGIKNDKIQLLSNIGIELNEKALCNMMPSVSYKIYLFIFRN